MLKLECKGTYTDATDREGTVYGKCDKVEQMVPGVRSKLKAS